jgi:uncharacterized protein YeaO (DUF488 family)
MPRLRTKRIYDPPEPDDGHRLLVMRLWPRGIRKELVDEWDRAGPHPELLADYRSKHIDWPEFERRYVVEMAERPESVATVAGLGERAARETITVLCSCEDASACHRSLLQTLVADP